MVTLTYLVRLDEISLVISQHFFELSLYIVDTEVQ